MPTSSSHPPGEEPRQIGVAVMFVAEPPHLGRWFPGGRSWQHWERRHVDFVPCRGELASVAICPSKNETDTLRGTLPIRGTAFAATWSERGTRPLRCTTESDRRRRRSASNPSTRLVPSYRRPSTVDDFAQYRASFVDAAIAYQPRHLLFENLRPGRRIPQKGASDRPVTAPGVNVVGMVTTPVSSGLP